MTTLDTLIASGPKEPGHGCRFPGCTEPTRATVGGVLRRFAEGSHTAGNIDGSVTRQASLCEAHAVEVWGKIMDAIPQS